MRFLAYSILVLMAMIPVGMVAHKDPGYMMLAIWGWTVESTVVAIMVVALVVFVLLYIIVRAVLNLLHMPGSVKQWRAYRKSDKAERFLQEGFTQLAAGNWSQAERLATKPVSNEKSSLVNYLTAARAAQGLKQLERRDHYLNAAEHKFPKEPLAVGLTRAELQIQQGEWQLAVNTLGKMHISAPKNRQVLALLAKVYEHEGYWPRLLELTPSIRKFKAMEEGQINALEHKACMAVIAGTGEDKGALEKVWQNLPARFKQDVDVLDAYIKQLLKQGASDIAEPLIRNALTHQWHDDLARLYGLIQSPDAKRQLDVAEGWLQLRKDNAIVLMTLGRLCLRNQLWGKARQYFEASASAGGPSEVYYELGLLLEALGEREQSHKTLRKGLAILSNTPLPALPCPETAAKLKLADKENKDGSDEAEPIVV